MKILLLANYENDRQESMLRFAALLKSKLEMTGVTVETISPRPFFGRLKRGATGIGKWLGYLDKFLVFPFALKQKTSRMGGDLVVHICDHSNAFYTRYLKAVPHLVTCNDLLAIRAARGDFPQQRTAFTGRILQRWILNGLRHARRITCISEATRKDFLALSSADPASVDVTYMGLNPVYSPMARQVALDRVRSLAGAGDSFILHVGGNQWYKNRVGVLAIYAALGDITRKTKLVMAGPPFDDGMNAFLHLHPAIASNVVSLSGVDDETLRALYSAAELLLFPSIEEGFGWPIIEAQACGCRVAVTGKPPMTEAGGEAAFYLPEPSANLDILPWSQAAAQVVKLALGQDEAARGTMVAKGIKNAGRFSAATMAQRYVAIYRELLYKP